MYGVGDVEGALRRACKGYVLGVKSDHHFGAWSGKPFVAGTALEIARDLDPAAGNAFPPRMAQKARGFMTGPIANWPISMLTNTVIRKPGFGRVAC